MYTRHILASLFVASALALSGCDYGNGYGYSRVSVGYGYVAPYGWYDGYYYPGSGYWLYDRGGHRHRWSDHHRRYWDGRRAHSRNWRDSAATQPWRGNSRGWSGRQWRGRSDQATGRSGWRHEGSRGGGRMRGDGQRSDRGHRHHDR